MEITRITWNPTNEGSTLLEVEHLDLITRDMVAFNLERSSDGTIIDGKFGQSKYLQFFSGESLLDFEEIFRLPAFTFKGEEVKMGKFDDRATLLQLDSIIRAIPVPDLSVPN